MYKNDQGYHHYLGQGDYSYPPMGYRGAPHSGPQPPHRFFMGRGGMKPPGPHHNRPPFGATNPRFGGPLPGHRPGRGFYTRGRGTRQNKLNHSGDSFGKMCVQMY